MSRVTRGLESVTQSQPSVSFVVKFHQVRSIIVRRQEQSCRRNATLVLFIQSDTCPITSPFLSADISKCFSMLNNIPMYSLAVRVSGRRLLWFPSLATRSRSRSICLVLTLSKPGWIQVAELLSLSLSRLSVFTQ